MLNKNKYIEVIICFQLLIVSTMIPVYLSIPDIKSIINVFELNLTWHIPLIIVLTIIFRGKVINMAYTIYIITGLFFLPVFHNGGSIGYILTPSFGYILGNYSLIYFIDQIHNKNKTLTMTLFIKSSTIGLFTMHLIGMTYLFFQLMYYGKLNMFLFNFAKYTLANIHLELLMLCPIILVLNPIKKLSIKLND